MNKLMKWLFCDKGNHKWEYYTAGNQLVSIEGKVGFADVPMRQCKRCEMVEQKLTDKYEPIKEALL